ncbi:MAG: SDR family oxidoreductase [Gemmatimonadaceae bacterium]|nr:SDR family oxidoreductase [Gemmatimonadaceae bacterium]
MTPVRGRLKASGQPAPLADRVALVTGAGTRVGQAIALAVGRAGATVAVHYHGSAAGARLTVAAIRDAGGAAFAVRSDLTRAGSPRALVARVARDAGRLDVVVNSAASMLRTPLRTVTERDWDRVFALNLRAVFFTSIEAARVMGPRGGVIVNISDHMGFESHPEYVPHGISKAGVSALTAALAGALAPRVRVNAVAPGFVLAQQGYAAAKRRAFERATPLRRLGTPADVAIAVLYLLTAPYVTGETLFVDGGRHSAR